MDEPPVKGIAMQRLLLAVTALPFVLLGCGPQDSDGDYLLDDFEIAIGTNPELADSDGDGFTDTEEYLQYFDPMDEDDFPYTGGYPRLPIPNEIEDEGWDVGDVTRNWDADDAQDQFGETVNIHKFYGSVVILDIAAEWCGPCRDAAPEAEAEYQDFKDRGFVVINVLLDGLSQDEEPDLDRWTEDLDLTFPVIGDHDQTIASNYIAQGESFGIPNFSIFDRELNIQARQINPVDWEMVDELLDEDPPQVEWPLPANAEDIRAELGITKLTVDYIVPGEGIPEASGAANIGGGGGNTGNTGNTDNTDNTDNTEGSGTSSSPDPVAPGHYGGPPYGGVGSGCTLAARPGRTSLTSLALFLFGLVLTRRRR
jgi:peroxiredoxin